MISSELRIGHDDLFSFTGKLMNLQGASIADLRCANPHRDAFSQPRRAPRRWSGTRA
ncbi:MAG: hypothetical protein IPK07_23630 [Deltaproteobacteria bacterium]|nr:hypothetical protein [Deltaproteobacteria bacterium]